MFIKKYFKLNYVYVKEDPKKIMKNIFRLIGFIIANVSKRDEKNQSFAMDNSTLNLNIDIK